MQSAYIGLIIKKSDRYENIVCEVNSDTLIGCDYAENEIDSLPTIVKQIRNYRNLLTGLKLPRFLINQTGILELFQLTISDFRRGNNNSWHYQDDPDGNPEKKIYLDLYNFIGKERNYRRLTDTLVNELIDMEEPRMNRIAIALGLL